MVIRTRPGRTVDGEASRVKLSRRMTCTSCGTGVPPLLWAGPPLPHATSVRAARDRPAAAHRGRHSLLRGIPRNACGGGEWSGQEIIRALFDHDLSLHTQI